MQLKNLVEFSAAGAGKTYSICKKSIELRDNQGLTSLIVTYTNKGKLAVETEFKKQNIGVLSNKVVIKTLYDFFLSDLAKPYQNYFLSTNQIKGVDFEKLYGFVNKYPDSSRRRYIESNGNVYPNELSKLILRLEELSGGLITKRLSEIYGAIFFDEIQDLSGYDLNIIEMIMLTPINVYCVGDYKQATYKTNNSQKNSAVSGRNCLAFFNALKEKRICDITFNNISRRCNGLICQFANELYPTEINMVPYDNKETGHDGVFAICESDIDSYYNLFSPQMLMYDKDSNNYGHHSLNFGICKGLTFDRVIISPNKPFKVYVESNKSLSSPEKYYVAVTRARFSVAIIFSKPPQKYREIIEMADGEKIFKVYRIK